MFVSKVRVVVGALALAAGTLGVFTGLAEARDVDIVITPPQLFFPTPQFRYDNGYYRTNEGHFYHYDRDRDGWHYGRTHREGMRWEERHHGR